MIRAMLPTLNKASTNVWPLNHQTSPVTTSWVPRWSNMKTTSSVSKFSKMQTRQWAMLYICQATTLQRPTKKNWLLKMAHPTVGTLQLFSMRYATDLPKVKHHFLHATHQSSPVTTSSLPRCSNIETTQWADVLHLSTHRLCFFPQAVT